jgi:anti-anti-sigma factor
MSLQFLSHSWQVGCVDDGIMVTLSQQELDSKRLWAMADELFELAQENGQPNLYVDFTNVRSLASVIFSILVSLDKRLRDGGCRLILCNLDPFVYQSFRATGLTENLDIRVS